MLDVVLEAQMLLFGHLTFDSFNPCCAGCSSGSGKHRGRDNDVSKVSILVVLDVVLEVAQQVSLVLF